MTPYEVENIAQQRVNSMRDEGANQRLANGQMVERPNNLSRAIAAAVAVLTLVGWIAQSL